jgi:O-antigen ligase
VLVGVGIWADLPNLTLTSGDTAGRRAVLGATVVAVAAVSAFLVRSRAGRRRGASLPHRLALALVLLAVLLGAVVTALPELGGERTLRRLVGAERAGYWRVAWHVVTAHPWLGSGGGTFGRAWLEQGPPALEGALDAHGLYIEALAELGPIGLGLLLVALAVPLVSARDAARASRFGAAAVAGYVAFLVHASVDWDWEMPAVTLPALALGAAVVILARRPASARPVGPRLRYALAAAAVLVAVASLLGLRSTTQPAAAAAPRATAARVP